MVFHSFMTEQLEEKKKTHSSPSEDDTTNKKKDYSEFEIFLSNNRKRHPTSSKGEDHIVTRVTEDWKLDVNVGNEISRLVKLVVRDYIQFWFVNISKRTDFLVDVEEVITFALCTLIRRGKDLINPYMFVGDKVCDVLVRTMSLFRTYRQKVLSENPNVNSDSSEFHKLVANEFRLGGHLHIALMAAAPSKNGNGPEVGDQRTKAFKHLHSFHNSAVEMSMEEFFDSDRLAQVESEYSFYVGGYLTKYLIDTKEESSKAVRHLCTEIISNIILGSVYWLITPSSLYYYIDLALSALKPATNSVEGSSLNAQNAFSEIDLHSGMKDYFVGGIGEENVSSSCCPMAIEAAAGIVLREGVGDNDGSKGEQLPSAGHFIVRKLMSNSLTRSFVETATFGSTPTLSLLPAVLCLSYVRPVSSAPSSTPLASVHWHASNAVLKRLSPIFHSLGLSMGEVLKLLTSKKKATYVDDHDVEERVLRSFYLDDRIGHVFFLAYTNEENLCYELFSCSHQVDLLAAIAQWNLMSKDKGSSGAVFSLDSLPHWENFENLMSSLQYVIPTKLFLNNSPSSVEPGEVGTVAGERSSEASNEKTLLLVEKDILLNHELEGAVDEYLQRKVSSEDKVLQIASSDETGKQAISRLLEVLQNICMHGWLKKSFATSHPSHVLCNLGSNMTLSHGARDDFGIRMVSSLSKMYAKILNATSHSHGIGSDSDNTYEEYLNKSPVLWLWLSHVITHCRGPRSSHCDSQLADNSMKEKLNISQHCTCLKCNDTYCYVHSMDIFLEHHGSFFLDKEVTLNSLFGCIFFCGLQTGKIFDTLEVVSLLFLSEGNYTAVDSAIEGVRGNFDFTSAAVDLVRSLSSQNLVVVPSDQFAPESLLRCPVEAAQALRLLLPLRDNYLHYFKSHRASDDSHHSISLLDQLMPSSPSHHKDKRRSSVLKSMSQKTFSAATSLLDDISSSLTSPARVLETEACRPRHLQFSTNMDIVQVSHIKLSTAEDKWHNKIGEGALYGCELQRKAEVSFILRILLRDRPPLEFLESRNICKPPRSDPSSRISPYNIEILKYEKIAVPLPGTSSTQQAVVYYIDVYHKQPNIPCPVHNESFERDKQGISHMSADGTRGDANSQLRIYPHKCKCKKWTIKRRYNDFDELHKHLKTQVGAAVFNRFKLPQKSYVQVVHSTFFYAKRLMGLREYLRSLLVGLPDMNEIHIFLSPDAETSSELPFVSSLPLSSSSSTGDLVSSGMNVSGGNSSSNSLSATAETLPPPERSEPKTKPESGDAQSSTTIEKVDSQSSTSSSTAPPLPHSVGSLGSQRLRMNKTSEDKPHVVDPRSISLLETRVYSLVDELLHVDGMGIIKKNIVSLICKSIGIFFNGTFVKWMQIQAQEETANMQITSLLSATRELFWPNDVFAVFEPAEEDEEAIRNTDMKLRKTCIDRLNDLLPTLLQGHDIVERVFFLIDNPYILKSLAYMVVDIIIIDLFPDLANKLSGMDALQK